MILAARPGDDELSPLGNGRAPHAVPVANVPLIEHAATAIRSCGARDVVVVVSRATGTELRSLLGNGSQLGIRTSYVEVPESVTFAGALHAARERLRGGPFVFHLGDSVVTDSLQAYAKELSRSQVDALLLARGARGAEPAGVVELDRRRLLRLADEPAVPPAEHLLAGVHFFTPAVLDAAAAAISGPRERQTAAATIAVLAANGGKLETRPVNGCWKYAGTVDGLLEANRMVLDEIAGDVTGADLAGARIEGRVVVHPSAVLDRTTVRGPAVIGAGAVLVDTFVGPYTAIGENVRLEGAEIEYSIVLSGATIRHPGKRLEASLVGQDATVAREFSLPAAMRLRVGRRAEISLP